MRLWLLCSALATATLERDWSDLVEGALAAWDLAAAERLIADAQPATLAAPNHQCAIAAVELERGAAAAAVARLANPQALAELPAERRAHCAQLAVRASAAASLHARAERRATAHFALYAEGQDTIVATYAADVLERAWQSSLADFAWQPLAKDTPTIGVEIFRDIAQLAAASGLPASAIETSGTVALCKEHRLLLLSPRATATGYAWADTLAHELTHLVVGRMSRGRAPVWLQEGLAKVHETSWRRPAGAYLSRAATARLQDAAHRHTLIGLERMHPSVALLPNRRDTALAFAEVASLVDRLRGHYGPAAFSTMLRRLGEGRSFASAWQPPFLSLRQEEARWRRALCRSKRISLPSLDADAAEEALDQERPSLQLAPSREPQVAPPKPSTSEAASLQWPQLARLGELMLLRDAPKAAATLYERALAAPHGRRPRTARRLAAAYATLGLSARAQALLEQAVAMAPEDVGGRLELARLLLARGDCSAALPHLTAVNYVNPFVIEVHEGLARCASERDDPEQARQERQFAALLAPT